MLFEFFSSIFFTSSFSSDNSIIHLLFFFMVFIMSLSVPVAFAIDVVNALKVKVTLVEECISVELVEMGKGIGGKTIFMFTGMNLHS